MHTIHSLDHVSLKTADNQLIEIPFVFVEQSNLLKVLNAERNDADFIKIPIDRKSFEFLYNSVQHPAANHLKNMSDQHYSHLMTVAEKLKCSIFYAELMEQLISNDAIQKIESFLDWKKLDEKIIKYLLNKRCIVKSRVNNDKPFIRCSTDDRYFVENISTKNNTRQINLWTSNPLQKIKTFDSYVIAEFNPMNDTLFLYNKHKNHDSSGCFYFIKENKKETLPSIHPDNLPDRFLFHPTHNIFYIGYINNGHQEHLFFRYITHEEKIELIEHSFSEIVGFHFLPNEEKIIYKNHEAKLIATAINGKMDEKMLAHHCLEGYIVQCKNKALIMNTYQREKLLIVTHNESSDNHIASYSIQRKQDVPSWFLPIKIAFNEKKSLYAYTASSHQINIIDMQGEVIASHNSTYHIDTIKFHPNGNHLMVTGCKNGLSPFPDIVTIWDIADISSNIKGKTIHTHLNIKDISFVNNDFFLTHGNRTVVWNMNGDKICTLSKNESAYALTPSHLITATHVNDLYQINGFCNTAIRRTKLYQTTNIQQTLHSYIPMRNKLSLSEKLLLCTYRNEKRNECSSNMPDGRALISLHNKIEKGKDSNDRRILRSLGKNLYVQPQRPLDD